MESLLCTVYPKISFSPCCYLAIIYYCLFMPYTCYLSPRALCKSCMPFATWQYTTSRATSKEIFKEFFPTQSPVWLALLWCRVTGARHGPFQPALPTLRRQEQRCQLSRAAQSSLRRELIALLSQSLPGMLPSLRTASLTAQPTL